ncbi:MAG: GNAT family N-acetyltransferase [Clostridia bacterium]|jgi:[ribosomal protein S5]-alanine N-acetyltransferase|nr:GNAT family N-acetyltransferase [Clostridia bacterium]
MEKYKDASIILETERMILRYQKAGDVEFLASLWSDKRVAQFTGSAHTKEWLCEEFEKTAEDPLAEKYDLWVVQDKQSGELLGHCGFIDKEVEGQTEYDICYFFAPKHWGKGLASEMALALKEYAFGDLGLKRIIALINPENVASAIVAKRIGMSLEKTIERDGGTVRDMYSIER